MHPTIMIVKAKVYRNLDDLLESLRTNSDPYLTKIDMEFSEINFSGKAAQLGTALHDNTTVTTIELHIFSLYSRADTANFVAEQCPFLRYLSTGPHLRAVIVDAFVCGHPNTFCAPILHAIGKNPNIEHLTWHYNVPLQQLAGVMARTTSIVHLSIGNLDVTEMTEPLRIAIKTLCSNTTLTSLHLCGSYKYSLVSLNPLLEQLGGHSRLEKLSLDSMVVPDVGLFRLLESNTKLSTLLLRVKSCDKESLDGLVCAIQGNSTLQRVVWKIDNKPARQTLHRPQALRIQGYVRRNQKMRAWFACARKASSLDSLNGEGNWPSILPSLLVASMPKPGTAPALATTARYHARPPPNAIFMALLRVEDDIGRAYVPLNLFSLLPHCIHMAWLCFFFRVMVIAAL
jgi:hypothetical protein